jgi:threonine/homoserine/homoserine lactone efflux protein
VPYLAYLGVWLLRARPVVGAAPDALADAMNGALAATTADAASVRPVSRELRQELAIALTNPKQQLFSARSSRCSSRRRRPRGSPASMRSARCSI